MSPYWAMALASASTHWYVPRPIAANIADRSRKIEYLGVLFRKEKEEKKKKKSLSESRLFDPLSDVLVALSPLPPGACRWLARDRASGTQRIVK